MGKKTFERMALVLVSGSGTDRIEGNRVAIVPGSDLLKRELQLSVDGLAVAILVEGEVEWKPTESGIELHGLDRRDRYHAFQIEPVADAALLAGMLATAPDIQGVDALPSEGRIFAVVRDGAGIHHSLTFRLGSDRKHLVGIEV